MGAWEWSGPVSDLPPLVIRFGRLGDLVLAWPALAWLARARGPVQLVTSAQYAPLMEVLPWVAGVHTVQGLPGTQGVREILDLASSIREQDHGPVIDLHASLRSRMLASALGGARARIDKSSTQRRLRIGVRFGDGWVRLGVAAIRSFPERYLDAVGGEGEAIPRAPATLLEPRDRPTLALLPGARRATKRWPAVRYGELARLWREEVGGPSLVFHGPGEEELAREAVEASGGRASAWTDLALPAVLAAMGRCHVAVGGDTGLLHLAGAAGARPVGLFGPTGAAMGYWPWEGLGQAVVPQLDCHPCTLYGSAGCPLGHHRCMQDLSAGQVMVTVREVFRR